MVSAALPKLSQCIKALKSVMQRAQEQEFEEGLLQSSKTVLEKMQDWSAKALLYKARQQDSLPFASAKDVNHLAATANKATAFLNHTMRA